MIITENVWVDRFSSMEAVCIDNKEDIDFIIMSSYDLSVFRSIFNIRGSSGITRICGIPVITTENIEPGTYLTGKTHYFDG